MKTLMKRKRRVVKYRDKASNKNQGLAIVFKPIQARIWAFTVILSEDNLAWNSQ